MEWSLNVNDMLKDEITKINNSLIPPGFEGDVRSIRLMQDSLSKVINSMGAQSAEAQALSKVITTAEKLRTADSHTLYLLKDAAANNGKGEVVGMLKVGRKHLFLFDECQTVREVEPLCVLDFYVKRERQHAGLGKALFDYMLKDMETTTVRMAVDGPSENMVSFLRKNYGVTRLLRQNNNFAVSPYFFDELAQNIGKSGASTPSHATGAVGRYTAPHPHSSIGNVIHGGVPFNSNSTGEERGGPPASSTPPPAPAPAARGDAGAGAGAGARRSPSRPRTLPVSAAPSPAAAAAVAATPEAEAAEAAAAGAPSRRDLQLTDQGFFDVKFYHKKLW